ncbi:MAG: hypothetical protein LBH01_04725 [Verrucomicrobiales bacterium]|jgi:predicted DNA-binding protein|nr:hypothetical protein [Verrucomicrobiales bacterium]
MKGLVLNKKMVLRMPGVLMERLNLVAKARGLSSSALAREAIIVSLKHEERRSLLVPMKLGDAKIK